MLIAPAALIVTGPFVCEKVFPKVMAAAPAVVEIENVPDEPWEIVPVVAVPVAVKVVLPVPDVVKLLFSVSVPTALKETPPPV
jgi:hypothetical protein